MEIGVGHGKLFLLETGTWRLIGQTPIGPEAVIDVSFSRDGTMLVTGSADGRLILWNAVPLKYITVLGKHDARIKDVAFSPDGREVVSCGDDKQIRLWDVGRRKLIRTIGEHSSPVYAIAWSPDGERIISGEHDRSVRIYTRRRSLWGWSLD